jgi:hypothetical protein
MVEDLVKLADSYEFRNKVVRAVIAIGQHGRVFSARDINRYFKSTMKTDPSPARIQAVLDTVTEIGFLTKSVEHNQARYRVNRLGG